MVCLERMPQILMNIPASRSLAPSPLRPRWFALFGKSKLIWSFFATLFLSAQIGNLRDRKKSMRKRVGESVERRLRRGRSWEGFLSAVACKMTILFGAHFVVYPRQGPHWPCSPRPTVAFRAIAFADKQISLPTGLIIEFERGGRW